MTIMGVQQISQRSRKASSVHPLETWYTRRYDLSVLVLRGKIQDIPTYVCRVHPYACAAPWPFVWDAQAYPRVSLFLYIGIRTAHFSNSICRIYIPSCAASRLAKESFLSRVRYDVIHFGVCRHTQGWSRSNLCHLNPWFLEWQIAIGIQWDLRDGEWVSKLLACRTSGLCRSDMERDVNLELSHSVRRYVLRVRIKVQILDCELIEEIVGKTGWCNSQYLNVNDFTKSGDHIWVDAVMHDWTIILTHDSWTLPVIGLSYHWASIFLPCPDWVCYCWS